MDCAKTGLLDPQKPGNYWKKVGDNYLQTVVGSNGYIVTSYPRKAADVSKDIQDMFMMTG